MYVCILIVAVYIPVLARPLSTCIPVASQKSLNDTVVLLLLLLLLLLLVLLLLPLLPLSPVVVDALPSAARDNCRLSRFVSAVDSCMPLSLNHPCNSILAIPSLHTLGVVLAVLEAVVVLTAVVLVAVLVVGVAVS